NTPLLQTLHHHVRVGTAIRGGTALPILSQLGHAAIHDKPRGLIRGFVSWRDSAQSHLALLELGSEATFLPRIAARGNRGPYHLRARPGYSGHTDPGQPRGRPTPSGRPQGGRASWAAIRQSRSKSRRRRPPYRSFGRLQAEAGARGPGAAAICDGAG